MPLWPLLHYTTGTFNHALTPPDKYWLLLSSEEQQRPPPRYIQVGEQRYIDAGEAYLQGLSDDDEEEEDRRIVNRGDIGAANAIPCLE